MKQPNTTTTTTPKKTDCSHHLRRHRGEGSTHAHMSSGGIAFHLMADVYPDLLDWVFNVARLKIMEVRRCWRCLGLAWWDVCMHVSSRRYIHHLTTTTTKHETDDDAYGLRQALPARARGERAGLLPLRHLLN